MHLEDALTGCSDSRCAWATLCSSAPKSVSPKHEDRQEPESTKLDIRKWCYTGRRWKEISGSSLDTPQDNKKQ